MNNRKLFDSELKVMELVWELEPVSAKQISVICNERIGWNKNTTYTILKKLVDKKIIRREEPNFICTSLIRKEEVQKEETESLIERLYAGSRKAFFAAFFENEELTDEEIAELKAMIDKR